MKSRCSAALVVLIFAASAVAQYKDALRDYRYEFPRDHFNHPQYQTEWWYYTGNIKSEDRHRYGFELTFFRQGIDPDRKAAGPWDIDDLYVAHLALSDLDGGTFLHAERTNRAGPGIAGISEQDRRIWNGNWRVSWHGNEQILQAIDERFSFYLTLQSAKPPVIHGENGMSQKAAGPGRASHYISMTRLNTSGEIQLSGQKFQVTGTAWMDHEFFTHQLDKDQVGWDWMSIQLEDHTELMLFRIRRNDGSIDPYSAGTFVDASGTATHLRNDEFTLEPVGPIWTSPSTHGAYSTRWQISVRRLGISLESSTSLPSQEIVPARFLPPYWEGAVSFQGRKGLTPARGVGYIEMTGYDRCVEALRTDGAKKKARTQSRPGPKTLTHRYWLTPGGAGSLSRRCLIRGIGTREVVNLTLRFILGNSITLLDLTHQLVPFPANHPKVIVGQFAPFLLGLADRLLPHSFNLVPVHGNLLSMLRGTHRNV